MTDDDRRRHLEQAKAVRAGLARCRREFKTGKISPAQVVAGEIEDLPWDAFKLRAFLKTIPGIGPSNTSRILRAMGSAGSTKLGSLSRTKRRVLASMVEVATGR